MKLSFTPPPVQKGSNNSSKVRLWSQKGKGYWWVAIMVWAWGLGASSIMAQTLQLVSTKSSFSGGNNISCYGAADGSISVAVIGADSLTLVVYKDNAQLDSGYVNTLPHQWTSLSAGDYVVKGYVSDSLVGVDSLRMYQPGSLGHAPPYIMNESCTPSHDGILSIEGMGGTLPYTYTWTGSSLPPSGGNGGLLDSLVAGTYYLNITDANGCSLTDTFTLTTATPPAISVYTNPLNEYGYHFNCHSEGSVWATPTGGTGNLTVSWVAKQVNRSIQKSTFGSLDTVETRNTYYLNYTDTITNQHSGTFIATVTDALGCTASDSLELKAPVDLYKDAALQFNPDYTEGSGLWAIKGKFTLAGGIPPYTIWGVENGPDTMTFYIGNTYPIKSTDAVSCYNWGDDSLNFTHQAYLQICQEFGGNCGGGNSSGTVNITGLNPSQYGGGYNLSARNSGDGSIQAYISGTCTGLSASLFYANALATSLASENVVSGEVLFDSLSAGNYVLVAYGCDSSLTDTARFTLTEPPPISVTITPNLYTHCSNYLYGQLQAEVLDGMPIYSYYWTRNDTLLSTDTYIYIWQPGTYKVLVTDQLGDSASVSYQVNYADPIQISIPGLAIDNATQNTSYGGSTPNNQQYLLPRCDVRSSFDVTITNGRAPFHFSWTGYNSYGMSSYYSYQEDPENIPSDINYMTLYLNDASGCSMGNYFKITFRKPQVQQITLTGTVKPNGYYTSCDTCRDGEYTLGLLDGGTPQNIQWYSLDGQTSNANDLFKLEGASMARNAFSMDSMNLAGYTPLGTAATQTNLAPETWYGVMATDNLGCKTGKTFTIERPKKRTEWGLHGNEGLDSTAYLGTCDSVDFVMKSNGNNNPMPQLRLMAAGGMEMNGQVRMLNFLKFQNDISATEEQIGSFQYLGIDANGVVKSIKPPNQNGFSCLYRNIWNKPARRFEMDANGYITDQTNLGVPSTNVDMVTCDPSTNIGIGINHTPNAKLHIKGDQILDGNIAITGERLFVDAITGNVGIGTLSPSSKLHLLGEIEISGSRLHVGSDGNVGIGITNPTHKLEVCGTIRSKEWIVETGWCDYRLVPTFKRMTAEEKFEYITKNGHLPNIDSGEKIEKEGLLVGKTMKGFIANIEDNTMDIISMAKENATQKEEIQRLKEENLRLRQKQNEIENRILKLEKE